MRQVVLAGEEADERPPVLVDGVADCPEKHRIPFLEGVQQRTLRRNTVDLDLYLEADIGEGPQVRRQHNPDHGKVWTSTDSTAGRSLTIGAQLSPALAEA